MSSVGTTPVSLGSAGQLVQNLGPDDLYVQPYSEVTEQTGFLVPAGKLFRLVTRMAAFMRFPKVPARFEL